MKKIRMSFNEIRAGARIALYGAGKRGRDVRQIASVCRPDIEVACYLDSFSSDPQSSPPTFKAAEFDPVRNGVAAIVICSHFQDAIAKHLEELGWLGNEAIEVYAFDWFSETMNREETAACETMLQTLRRELPDASFVYDALCRLEMLKNNPQAALEYSLQAMALFADDAWVRLAHGAALRQDGRLDEALKVYEAVVQAFPEIPAGHLELARTLSLRHSFIEAEQAYKIAVARFPDDVDVRLGHVELLHRVNRHVEAEEAVEAMAREFPDNAAVRMNCARRLKRLSRFDEAQSAYSETIEAFPDNPTAYIERAEALMNANDKREALQAFKTARRMFPNNPEGFIGHGRALESLGRLEDAEAIHSETISLFPYVPEGYVRRAHVLMLMGRLEDAETTLRNGKAFSCDTLEVLHWLKTAYILQGKNGEARRILQETWTKAQRRSVGYGKIIFNHIPKCGGTTVVNYLIGHYTDAVTMGTLPSRTDHGPKLAAYFTALDEADKAKYSFIYGHAARYLIPHVSRSMIRATILRDPVERALSAYWYDKKTRGYSFDMSLSEYFDKGAQRIYVNWLTSDEDRRRLSGEELVRHCFAQINRQYDVIGVTENMQGFLDALRGAARLSIPYTGARSNVVLKRKKTEDVDPAVIELARERLALDIQLYSMVKARCEATSPQDESAAS